MSKPSIAADDRAKQRTAAETAKVNASLRASGLAKTKQTSIRLSKRAITATNIDSRISEIRSIEQECRAAGLSQSAEYRYIRAGMTLDEVRRDIRANAGSAPRKASPTSTRTSAPRAEPALTASEIYARRKG